MRLLQNRFSDTCVTSSEFASEHNLFANVQDAVSFHNQLVFRTSYCQEDLLKNEMLLWQCKVHMQ